jgi:Isopropylmalate/homocitrate/citramalate synthases
MAITDLILLDCTLRDGGYINNWNWGFETAKNIIYSLVKSGVDVVEVGFLRNIESYDKNITVCNTIEELNRLLPTMNTNTIFSGMAMRSNYTVSKLTPYSGKGISLIRVTAHDYDINEGLEFASAVKEKGYKVSINPINIMGYKDEQIIKIIKKVNAIQPYQFCIVDTFGSIKRRDLDRIVSLVEHNLDKTIRLGLHLHENMALSFSLAQRFVDMHLNRPISIDGSLMGMGRIPGNLPIELIADYLNDYDNKNYDIDYMMDSIQDYIFPLKGTSNWGYTPSYFLSARYNLHRNYAEHYLKKGDLTHRDINHILSRFDRSKANVFDKIYADNLYNEYKNNRIDDSKSFEQLRKIFNRRDVLILSPGVSIKSQKDVIDHFISSVKPVIISTNFISDEYKIDYAFFSNNKRINQIYDKNAIKFICTSNISTEIDIDYLIDYNRLVPAFEQGNNSLIMLLKLLKDCELKNISIAGADGYKVGTENYYVANLHSLKQNGDNYNIAVSDAIKKLNLDITFITPSEYAIK